ncbi:MAG: hypothetical protein ACI8XZ_004456 [Gammaproteobacteria bacterium]|jgi:hypothetical protein
MECSSRPFARFAELRDSWSIDPNQFKRFCELLSFLLALTNLLD